jgi:hypothetical protein
MSRGARLGIEEKLTLDLWYVRHVSLDLDLRILARTLAMVVRGEEFAPGPVVRATLALARGGVGRRHAAGCRRQPVIALSGNFVCGRA